MNSEKNYENAPADIAEAIEHAEVVPDLLPAPGQLVPPEGRTFTATYSASRRLSGSYPGGVRLRLTGLRLSIC